MSARRILYTLYFAVLAYIIGVGFFSVVPQVFSHPPKNAVALNATECEQLLQRSYFDLLAFHQALINPNNQDPKLARSFFSNWDSNAKQLQSPACNADALKYLTHFRYHTELSIENYLRRDAPLARKVLQLTQTHEP